MPNTEHLNPRWLGLKPDFEALNEPLLGLEFGPYPPYRLGVLCRPDPHPHGLLQHGLERFLSPLAGWP